MATLIRFGSYNIHNGYNRGMELALLGMVQANPDLGVFREAKLIDGIYTRNL